MPITRRITIGFAVSLFLMLVILPSMNSETKGKEKTEAAALADCATDVKNALAAKFTPAVMAVITVEVTGSTATLTGTVNYSGTRKEAAKVARGVACVKKVVNNIRVQLVSLGCDQHHIMCCTQSGGCECIPRGTPCQIVKAKRR